METLQTEEQRKKLDNLLTPIWRKSRRWRRLLRDVEYVKNNPEDKRSKSLIAKWRSKFDTFDEERQGLLKELFEALNIRLEKLTQKQLNDRIFFSKLEEWKEWKANGCEPKDKEFTDGGSIVVWEQSTRLNSVTAKRHKKVLKDAGFTLDKQGEKIEEAMGKIKRLKEHEDKHGNLNDLPNKEDERFLHAVKALYRKINAGTAKPTPYSRKVFSEVDKQFNKTFIWMPSKTEKIPNISATKQVSSAGNESISYKFNVSFDGECRQYMRKDLVLLKEMRDKVMEAGHHIDFPKPPAHNKGRDNWKKKAEAEKEANKPYWEKHGWDDKKIQILKDNYKELTDKELSEGLLKSRTSKAISAKREELGLLKKRSDSEPIELGMTTAKPNKGNTRYVIYLGIDYPEGKKKWQVNFSSSDKKLAGKALAFYQEKINNWDGTYQELKDSFVYDKQRNRKEIEAEAQELGIPIASERGNPLELGGLVRKIESVKAGTYKKKSSRKELEARARELGAPITTESRGNVGAGGKPMPLRDLARAIERTKAGLPLKRNRKELEARALKLGVSITTDPYNGFSGGEPLGLKRLEERIKEAENK